MPKAQTVNEVLSTVDVFSIGKTIGQAMEAGNRASYAEGYRAGYRKGVEETRQICIEEMQKLRDSLKPKK